MTSSSWIPPSGPLQDSELTPYIPFLQRRIKMYEEEYKRICHTWGTLAEYASVHQTLGMHKITDENGQTYWRLREWMPAASDIWLTTDRLRFLRRGRFMFRRIHEEGWPKGLWELQVPLEELQHGTYMELLVTSPFTVHPERRVPAFAVWVEQDAKVQTQWCARVWDPPTPYHFLHDNQRKEQFFPRIYEAHVGIAQPSEHHIKDSVGSFAAFTRDILPRIKDGGYTIVQLMGILEHPLYRSFGYQVCNYFAVSSRFGTPDDFKKLVDEAHKLGLLVVLDIPHSHSCPNTEQGLARYDTSNYLFATKENQWGTLSFDYNKEMARRFLLSNCHYWLETFHVDGFRFDAVGNMIYTDHGFGDDFSHVGRCFFTEEGVPRVDEAGVLYLQLANTLVHEQVSHSITIAEEFSGMPGMTSSPSDAGLGFDYRFAMGIPDFWSKFIKEGRSMGSLWYEMTNHRPYERTISYVECHDQCINGKDAMIWRLIGDEMYHTMSCFKDSWKTSRGIALHKLMRFVTFATAGHGYLNFMGNEFGHPEWIDAEDYAHRQWHLADTDHLKYHALAVFDQDMLALVRQYPSSFTAQPWFRYVHEDDRVLAFTRGKLLFVFNFHEFQSQTHLNLLVPPGKYVERLSTDEERYAGHGNLKTAGKQTEHFSLPVAQTDQLITIYLPPLVGLVLEQQ